MSQSRKNQASHSVRQGSQSSGQEILPPKFQPSARVNAPAIGIMAASTAGVVLAVIGLLSNITGVRPGAVGALGSEQNLDHAEVSMGELVFEILRPAVSIFVCVFCIIGAHKMKNLERYRLSMAASVLIMMPWHSLSCLLGLPFGIWAIIVLNDSQVKSAFQS